MAIKGTGIDDVPETIQYAKAKEVEQERKKREAVSGISTIQYAKRKPTTMERIKQAGSSIAQTGGKALQGASSQWGQVQKMMPRPAPARRSARGSPPKQSSDDIMGMFGFGSSPRSSRPRRQAQSRDPFDVGDPFNLGAIGMGPKKPKQKSKSSGKNIVIHVHLKGR